MKKKISEMSIAELEELSATYQKWANRFFVISITCGAVSFACAILSMVLK